LRDIENLSKLTASHLQFLTMASSSSDSDFVFDGDCEEAMAVFAVSLSAISSSALFTSRELDDLDQSFVDRTVSIKDQLAAFSRMPSLFKNLTNFTLTEFEELSQIVCPTIANYARSTGLARGVNGGRPTKLDPAQRLLNCIMLLKHDNTSIFDGTHWNWSKSSVCDDAIFVATCVNEAIGGEISWPNAAQRFELGRRIQQFPGCIGYIDGTLCMIRRPHHDPNARRWFNGRKKIYSTNNTVVVDHDGLIIYIDAGYCGSFHDVNILRNSTLHQNWRAYFHHTDEYFEYLLGDPGYLGEDMYIMRRVGSRESIDDGPARNVIEDTVINAFNKVHAGVRVRVEWGIGGMKRKWKRMMKRFDHTKTKFPIYFKTACLLTNFSHRRRMDLHTEDIRMAIDEDDNGWDGDF
jgi:hypothetical protein